MAEAKVLITGPIVGDSKEAGDAWPFTLLEDVIAQLDWQKPFDTVHVTINSPGGRVDKGMGIYDFLRSLGPGVTIKTEAIGQCSSIATAIFLAGSERLIHPHTEFMIHLPSGGVLGTAETIQEYATAMARCQQSLIDLYVERAGVDATAIMEVMRRETELTAEECLSLGFATAVVQPITALATLPKTAAVTVGATPATSEPQPAAPAPSIMSTLLAQAKNLVASISNLGKAPVTSLAVTTTGDSPTTLTIDTGDRDTYEVGDNVYTDEAMTEAAADGAYDVTDGNTITVTDGAISAFAATASEEGAPATASDADGVNGQILVAIQGLTSVVTGLQAQVTAISKKQAATNQRMNTIAAATGSAAVVEADDVPTQSQQGKTTIKTGQSAADRRAEKQKQNRKL
ncbi:Clp protease ClpP [Hymenobacter pini]|uniref:Clp protease ClpP n=1 Tax=Hymenobacter pini TaxID=2880879 RepID=UPI001CF5DE78|nr:Clp protease ClpP [Hymenobacter pini]MCA8830283.1 Clp protease ClpP [Hymenobacter pini]